MMYVTGALLSEGSQGEPDAEWLIDQKEMAASLEDVSCTSTGTAPTFFFLMIIRVHTYKERLLASLSLWQPVPLLRASYRLTAPHSGPD